jgi:hypothetical protein
LISGVTRFFIPAISKTSPITVIRIPTVRTSHRSSLGPVTHKKLGMCTSGQIPVTAQ